MTATSNQRQVSRDTRSAVHTLHEAIAASFALDREGVIQRLGGFREAEWSRALDWLDVSGIALYFLNRMCRLGTDCVLPPLIEAALADRLRRNRARMQSLCDQAFAMAGRLQGAGVPYALLKGMTLAPHSVPDIALRSQSDLDFLVPAGERDLAVKHVHAAGYRLQVESRTTLEFRAPGFDAPTLARLYSAQAPRALDLHLVSDIDARRPMFARRVHRSIGGISVYALAPADILVQQARHLLQHLCSEFTRLSWVLEFRQHVLTRRRDLQFWRQAAEFACEQENGNLAMAISFWLARDLFGDFPVELAVPAQWQADALPGRVRLWLELYARRVLLSADLRSKLYGLLHKEVPCGAHERRSTRAILFPRCFPRPVMDRRPAESVLQRLHSMGINMGFFLLRLRFHVIEGLSFGMEASRWKRAIARSEAMTSKAEL